VQDYLKTNNGQDDNQDFNYDIGKLGYNISPAEEPDLVGSAGEPDSIAPTSANSILPDEIDPDALSSLQVMLGHNAEFKAIEQFQAYHLLKSWSKHVLHVAPTGFGKTLPFQLAAATLQDGKLIIMILPYRILYGQMLKSMRDQSVTYAQWSKKNPIPSKHVQVMGTPLEALGQEVFQTTIRHLNDSNRLFAIVLDKMSSN
jgi:hypothetical protein